MNDILIKYVLVVFMSLNSSFLDASFPDVSFSAPSLNTSSPSALSLDTSFTGVSSQNTVLDASSIASFTTRIFLGY